MREDARIKKILMQYGEYKTLVFNVINQEIFNYLYFKIDKDLSFLNESYKTEYWNSQIRTLLLEINKKYLLPNIKYTFIDYSLAEEVLLYFHNNKKSLFRLFVNQYEYKNFKNGPYEINDRSYDLDNNKYLYKEKDALINGYINKKKESRAPNYSYPIILSHQKIGQQLSESLGKELLWTLPQTLDVIYAGEQTFIQLKDFVEIGVKEIEQTKHPITIEFMNCLCTNKDFSYEIVKYRYFNNENLNFEGSVQDINLGIFKRYLVEKLFILLHSVIKLDIINPNTSYSSTNTQIELNRLNKININKYIENQKIKEEILSRVQNSKGKSLSILDKFKNLFSSKEKK